MLKTELIKPSLSSGGSVGVVFLEVFSEVAAFVLGLEVDDLASGLSSTVFLDGVDVLEGLGLARLNFFFFLDLVLPAVSEVGVALECLLLDAGFRLTKSVDLDAETDGSSDAGVDATGCGGVSTFFCFVGVSGSSGSLSDVEDVF